MTILRALFTAAGVLMSASTAFPVEPGDPASLFGFDKIHSAHLIFARDQWEAIKPDEPQRGPGGPFNFSPGAMLAPGFQMAMDSDKNGAISREEFAGTFDRWFKTWDAKQQGYLDDGAIRDGMNKVLALSFGPPPGGANAAPSPGGRAPVLGGPLGFSLQSRDGLRNGLVGMMGLDFEYVHADLEFDGEKLIDVAVRYKGNGTYMDARNSEKKSFKVDLNEFVKGQKLHGLSKLNFHSNITDVAWMNESLAYALYRDAGVPAPRTAFLRLMVSVPGMRDRRLLGLYTLVENPDANWARDRFGSKDGLILKPSTRELFIDKGINWSAYRQAYDAKTDISEKQVQRVVSFAKLVTSANDEEFAAKLPEFLDVDQFARFMAVTVWTSSTDSILMVGQNYVIHLDPETGKFVFSPWDLDRAFGNFLFPTPDELSIRKAWVEDSRFLNRVMSVPVVQEAYTARLEEFQKTIFEPARLMKQIDEIAALIWPAVEEEGAEKLARFDRALSTDQGGAAPEQAGPAGSGGFRMPGSRPLKTFIKARHQSVADQLAGKSEGRPLGNGFGPPPRAGGPGGSPSGGERQNFGPGRFLGPVLTKFADTDENKQITLQEFQALATRWFTEWDADHDGSLTPEQLQEGLGKAFPPPTPNQQQAPQPSQ